MPRTNVITKRIDEATAEALEARAAQNFCSLQEAAEDWEREAQAKGNYPEVYIRISPDELGRYAANLARWLHPKMSKRAGPHKPAGPLATTRGEMKLETRARCFRGSNGGNGVLATYQFSVDPDGTARVYDSVAKHYTIHHGMAPREESRVRNLVRARGLLVFDDFGGQA